MRRVTSNGLALRQAQGHPPAGVTASRF